MSGDIYLLVAGVPPPWDECTVRQILYLRHRLALEPHDAIARRYGISESGVRHALGRIQRAFQVTREADLLVLAERDGVRPLKLCEVDQGVGCASEC